MGAQGAAAAGGGPLRRLPSPPRLAHLCLRCFSARSCFCEWLRDLQLLLQLAAGAFRVSGCGVVDSRSVKTEALQVESVALQVLKYFVCTLHITTVSALFAHASCVCALIVRIVSVIKLRLCIAIGCALCTCLINIPAVCMCAPDESADAAEASARLRHRGF